MTFSLILATVGRTDELKTFLDSLSAQLGVSYELILIDQNPDDRLTAILEPYRDAFPIVHLRSSPGLSKARNLGLAAAAGDVVAFPDDDCAYPAGCLAYVNDHFQHHPEHGGLTGRTVTRDGHSSVGKFDSVRGPVTKYNVWQRGVSITIFLRRQVLKGIRFDETLGAGARWGSGEETDLLLQVLMQGAQLMYDPSLRVIHPPLAATYDTGTAQKALSYGAGMGRVLHKHHYPLWYKANYLLRPLGGSLVSLLKGDPGKTKYYWNSLRGRWSGLW